MPTIGYKSFYCDVLRNFARFLITKSNTPPSVECIFVKLYKWYQVSQRISYDWAFERTMRWVRNWTHYIYAISSWRELFKRFENELDFFYWGNNFIVHSLMNSYPSQNIRVKVSRKTSFVHKWLTGKAKKTHPHTRSRTCSHQAHF